MKHIINALLLTCILAGSGFGAQPKQGDSSSRGQIAWVHFEKADDVYDGKPYLWLGHGDIKLVIDVRPRPDHDLELLWGAKGDIRNATAIVNGSEVKLSSGGYSGFRWLSVPFPESLSGDKYELLLKKAAQQYAFIAAVRLSGRQTEGSKPAPKSPVHRITFTTTAPAQPPTSRSYQSHAEMHAIWNSPPLPPLDPLQDRNREAAFREAARNGLRANQAFFRSRLFIDGWLKHADPDTGLIPRNLNRSRDIWNAKDSAADNYPFMVVTAAMTDRELLDGRMLEMLRTETRLTSRIGNMPDTWSFSGKGFSTDKANLDSIIFGSSEYMKDGLLAVTEWLGNCPWTDRMIGILDDVWKHAPVDTPFGRIPSTSTEVNGEMLQVTCRMYWMTGKKEYLEYAYRLGDYYLLGKNHPTRDMEKLTLIAHGGETVSGLCELYATVNAAAPGKKKEYEKPLYEMLDRILEIGRNEHGMIYSSINPIKGTHSGRIVDTWGYTYNAYYTVYMVDKVEKYREAVRKAMRSMKEHYTDYRWEGGSNDGFADSIEGGLNLHNRDPVDTIPEWIDHEILYMFKKQRPDGVIEGWHGDGNSARTWLMYALWKTQGLTIRPWRKDVRFGAVERDGELCISLVADKPWKGILLFDKARHKTNLHLPIDYPRLNQFPEWFVTDSGKEYSLLEVSADVRKQLSGKQLVDGIALELSPGTELRLSVLPGDGRAISDRKGITLGAATSAIAKKAAENPDPVKLVRKVADAVIRDFPKPPPFNWGEGTLLTGMMRAHLLTRDKRYLDFVRRFADHHHKAGIGKTLARRGYCGHWGPGYPMLMLYEITKDKHHLELAEEINVFMMKKAERTKDGGLSHFNGKLQLWVDTLDMCCPVFSNLARIEKRPELQEEAIRQLEIFARHLQNPETGLFYHMWDEKSAKHTPSFWARGNGWVVMSYTEVLKNEKKGSSGSTRLVVPFKKQLAGIVPFQDKETGLWHTVLDKPDTYLEGSASAMYLYGMLECRNLKLFDVPYEDTMRRGWAGLAKTVGANGRVGGVSAGTGPSGKSGYQAKKLGTYTWGTGAFLLAGCAYAESDLK
jgi:rhamnogalacturonyl hydrolase YesR